MVEWKTPIQARPLTDDELENIDDILEGHKDCVNFKF